MNSKAKDAVIMLKNSPPEVIISCIIMNETREMELYKMLSHIAPEVDGAIFFSGLSKEVKRVKEFLEKIYSNLFPEIDIVEDVPTPISPINPEEYLEVESYESLLHAVLDVEEEVVGFYRELSRSCSNSDLKKLLEFLSQIKERHRDLIRAEYELYKKLKGANRS